ncbi:MAG: PEGA domain-containing protein [Dongiaceae bacterium]
MRTVAMLLILVATPALAERKAEREAKALFKEANQLAQSGDYLGALEMFQAAYARFPNPKILINMASVLEALGRNVEAAEAYEKFLQSEDAPKARKPEVQQLLVALDARIGRLQIEVDPPDARVSVDGKPAGEPGKPLDVRVDPGGHAVMAEKEGFAPTMRTVKVEAGEKRGVLLKLTPGGAPPPAVTPVPTPPTPAAPPDGPAAEPAEPSVAAQVEPAIPEEEGSLSHAGQVGLVLRSESDLRDFSAAPTAGLTYGVGSYVELSALALIQRVMGARIAASLLILPDSALKPFVRLGVPMFLEGGTAVGVHGGAGLLWDYSRNLGIGLDVSAEHFSKFDSYTAVLIGLGVQARAF